MSQDAALDLIIQLKGDAEKQVGNLAKSGGFLSQAFSFATGGLLAQGIQGIAGAVGNFFSSSIGESQQWSSAMSQAESVVKSTGGAAGLTAQQLGDLASSLSGANGVSKFADDAILSMENVEATFTNIGKTTFPAATQAILDVSQAMGQDLQGTAVQVGKALNDPINGISALTRIGVTFTDEQKAQIAAMQKAGDTAGAQAIIIKELGREFGGSALAAAKTFDGQMFTLSEQFNNVKQVIGDALIPILTGLIGFISSPGFMGVLQGLATLLANGLTQGAALLGAAFQAVLPYLQGFFNFLSAQFTEGGGYDLSQFLSGLPGPIQIVGQFIGELAANFGAFFYDLQHGTGFLEAFIGLIGDNLIVLLENLGASDSVLQAIGQAFYQIGTAVQAFWTALTSGGDIGAAFGDLAGKMLPALAQVGGALLSWVASIIPPLLAQLGQWAHAFVDWIRPMIGPALEQLASWSGQIFSWLLGTALPALINQLGTFGAALWQWIGPMIGPALTQLAVWGGQIVGWIVNTGLPALVGAVGSLAAALWNWIGPMIGPALTQLAVWGAQLWAWFTNTGLPALVSTLGGWAAGLWNWIAATAPLVIAQLGVWAGQLWSWFTTTGLPALVTQMAVWGTQLGAWIGDAAGKLPGLLGTWLGTFTGWLVANLPTLVTQMAVWGTQIGSWIGDAAAKLPGLLGTWLGQLTGWMVKTGIPTLVTQMNVWGAQIVSWITDAAPQAVAAIGDFFQGIWDWLTGTGQPAGKTNMNTTGTNLIQGLIDGVGGMLDTAVKAIKDFFGSFVAGFQDAAGIHSASTVFHGFGGDIIQGLLDGLQGAWTGVTTWLNGAIAALWKQITDFLGQAGKILGNVIPGGNASTQAVLGGAAGTNALGGGFGGVLSARLEISGPVYISIDGGPYQRGRATVQQSVALRYLEDNARV